MDAYDPAGNLITFDPNLANKSVTMDNTPPKVTSVSLSTNNSRTLFNDLTGQARPNDLVAFYQDNVTLKFETSERVRIQPKVKINGDMKLATAQVIDNITDTSGTKWQAVYQVKDNDTGLVIFSNFFGLDPAGNYLEYDNNTVQSLTTVTMDTSQPSVTSVELSTDNILSGTLYDNVTGLARDNDSVVKAIRYRSG